MSKLSERELIVYASQLNKIGGVETFVLNFCKRLKNHYSIIFCYDNCDAELLKKIAAHVRTEKLQNRLIKTDVLVLATAWGRTPEGRIEAPMQIQTVHADYVVFAKEFNFHYTRLKGTTHHVAVSKHVAKQFEIATPHKIDKVIYNML